MSNIKTLHIAIVIFNQAEVLDFSGPFEVFSTASRLCQRQQQNEPFMVSLVAETNQPVYARGHFQVVPHHALSDLSAVDILVVAGGDVSEALERPILLSELQRLHQSSQITASVCTGAFLLAKTGILAQGYATTHWEDQADLRAQYPQLEVLSDIAWVDTGRIISSGGISAGIDMSLYLVERLHSRELALNTAKQMEYRWQDSGLILSGQ